MPRPGAGTVDRVGVASATKTLPSTDYKGGSGWPPKLDLVTPRSGVLSVSQLVIHYARGLRL